MSISPTGALRRCNREKLAGSEVPVLFTPYQSMEPNET